MYIHAERTFKTLVYFHFTYVHARKKQHQLTKQLRSPNTKLNSVEPQNKSKSWTLWGAYSTFPKHVFALVDVSIAASGSSFQKADRKLRWPSRWGEARVSFPNATAPAPCPSTNRWAFLRLIIGLIFEIFLSPNQILCDWNLTSGLGGGWRVDRKTPVGPFVLFFLLCLRDVQKLMHKLRLPFQTWDYVRTENA